MSTKVHLYAATILVLASVIASAQEPKPRSPAPPPAPTVPDKTYSRFMMYNPQVGDRLVLWGQGKEGAASVVVAESYEDLVELAKARAAKDAVGIKKLEDRKRILSQAQMTQVIILEVHDNSAGVGRTMSLDSYLQSRQAAALDTRFHMPAACRIRIMAGRENERIVWALNDEVAKAVEDEPASRPRSRPAARAMRKGPEANKVDPEARAKSLLNSGLNLERIGNKAGALDFYRRLVKDCPGTPQAAEANRRIGSIAGEKVKL